jgi:hypothetical protein
MNSDYPKNAEPQKNKKMDIQAIKKRIVSGEITDEEFTRLMTPAPVKNHKTGFMSNVLKGIKEGYTEPMLFRALMEFLLLLVLITSLVILTYTGVLSTETGALLLAVFTGFLFGRIR